VCETFSLHPLYSTDSDVAHDVMQIMKALSTCLHRKPK